MQESQGRGGLVCHVAELQTQEWNMLSLIPIPLTKVPQLPSPCPPGAAPVQGSQWGFPSTLTPLTSPSPARLPMPVFGEQSCQHREPGRIRADVEQGQQGSSDCLRVRVSSEEGVERVRVFLWASERVEMRTSCCLEGSVLPLGGDERGQKALQHSAVPLSASCPEECP